MADWLDSIEARNKAQAKYDKSHTAGFYMKLNTRTDSDIIRWLWGQPSKQGAIKPTDYPVIWKRVRKPLFQITG